MSIVLVGSTSGSITLQEPAVAGSTVLSLPATTGTVLTSASPASDLPSSINGPAFSAYQSSAQSLTANTITKIQFQTEEFDTANCFDSTTNYRFTPNVAGYYFVNACVCFTTTRTYTVVYIYKNGVNAKLNNNGNGTTGLGGSASGLIYFNGSTDYVELYALNGATQNVNTGATDTYFQAFLVRSA